MYLLTQLDRGHLHVTSYGMFQESLDKKGKSKLKRKKERWMGVASSQRQDNLSKSVKKVPILSISQTYGILKVVPFRNALTG